MKWVLFFTMLLSSKIVLANQDCQSFFQQKPYFRSSIQGIDFNQLFPYLREKYPVLSRILTGKVLDRAERIQNKIGWKQIHNNIRDCSSAACSFELQTNEFYFRATVQIVREENRTVLDLIINQFVVSKENPEGSSHKKSLMKFGERPHGASIQFINLISVVFTSIYKALESNPQISVVRIVGENTVNLALSRSLREMGFVPSEADLPSKLTSPYAPYLLLNTPNLLMSLMYSKLFNAYSIAFGKVGLSVVASGLVYVFNRRNSNYVAGQDWILELPLVIPEKSLDSAESVQN